MTGFSAGYAHDGGGGGPYGYPARGCGEFYGSSNPVRRGERARIIAAGGDARHNCTPEYPAGYAAGYEHDGGGGSPFGYLWMDPAGELQPGPRWPADAGYGVGAQRAVLSRMPQVRMPWPDAEGVARAPRGAQDGEGFIAAFPDGTTAMMICCGGKCCTYGYGDCKGFLFNCIKDKIGKHGSSGAAGGGWIKGAPTAREQECASICAKAHWNGSFSDYQNCMNTCGQFQMRSVTPASGKSARAVRRFELMAASRRSAGMSVGYAHDGGGGAAAQGGGQPGPYGYPMLEPTQGIFYGAQNPVRNAMRDRQFPSGRQNTLGGFAPDGYTVGGCGPGGCDGGSCGCG